MRGGVSGGAGPFDNQYTRAAYLSQSPLGLVGPDGATDKVEGAVANAVRFQVAGGSGGTLGGDVAHRTEYRPYSTNTRLGSVQPHSAKLKLSLSTTLSKLYDERETLLVLKPRSMQRNSW